jgi:hypothetical protein
LKNVTEQAVKKLREERPNVKLEAFISWLESNRQLLNSAVYGPIVKEIELADSRYASIVEKQVRPEDLLVSLIVHVIMKSFIHQVTEDCFP